MDLDLDLWIAPTTATHSAWSAWSAVVQELCPRAGRDSGERVSGAWPRVAPWTGFVGGGTGREPEKRLTAGAKVRQKPPAFREKGSHCEWVRDWPDDPTATGGLR